MNKKCLIRIIIPAVLLGILAASCHKRNHENPNETVFSMITGYKWSINPDKGPDGSILHILRNPHVDFWQYYAFNADSTVDYFCENEYATGKFYVEGNYVTCMFVETEGPENIVIADDGEYNKKVVLNYEDDKLYKYDILYRTKDDVWVSELPIEYRKLYYEKAGYYANNKYNTNFYEFGDYDTTVDAMTVVERYNWREEICYKSGKRHGIYKKYENGKLQVFGTYANGVPTGDWYWFSPSGQLAKCETKDLSSRNLGIQPDNEQKKKYDGAVVFFIQNPNLMSDEEKANPIPTGWIYFEEDEWKVNDEQMKTLEIVARQLEGRPKEYLCWVVGISSYTGSDHYCMKKSEKRAMEVAKKLKEKFNVSPSRVFVDFKGKTINYGLF